MQLVPTYRVTAVPSPLKAEMDDFYVGHGCSIEDALLETAYRADLAPGFLADAIVIIDDTKVDQAAWCSTFPRPGQQVLVIAMPGGKFGSLITTIALIAVNFIPGFQGLHLALRIAITIGITVAGTLITQALTPVPKQRAGANANDPVTNSITGVRNEARPYGVIPRIFGKIVNFHPPLSAAPYTEFFADNEQYVRMSFCLGYGPLAVSVLKFGETPITQFPDVTYEIKEGYSTDTPMKLFPAQVREESLNIQLKQSNGYSQRTTPIDTDEIQVDVIFPNGLMTISSRTVQFQLRVQFQLQYRAVGSSTWLNAPITGGLADGGGLFTIRGKTKSALRRSVRFTVSSGRYQVRLRRVTKDNQAPDFDTDKQTHITVEDSYWSAVRSIRTDPPVNNTEGLAFVNIRARASDSLNGFIDNFNCTVQAVVPRWNGATWVNTATRSPAWAFAEVLRGAANARPLADSRIDLAHLVYWDANDGGYTFDAVLDSQRSVFEVLQDIAATGNGSLAIPNGLYSVLLDEPRSTVVQHFTPRNSRNFTGQRIYATRPHAIRVRFPNESTLHQYDERYVYNTGRNASNSTIFETIQLPYTTNASQAWKRGRRALFAAQLRPEIYSLEVDIEQIVCTRGDLVRVTHDVPLWGIGSARVRSLVTSGPDTTGVVLDAPVPMEALGSYSLRFRLATGDTLLVPVDTDAGETAELTFTTPVATASGPAIGDLALFGETGSESVELIVRSIEPRDQHAATITFVDYAPEVFESDSGPIPDHDPQITLPPTVLRSKPPAPTIMSIDSSETVLTRASDGTLTSRIAVMLQVNQTLQDSIAEVIQGRYRLATTDNDYLPIPSAPAPLATLSVSPVEDGDSYELQFWTVSHVGERSDRISITHTVVGKTSIPPDVERMYRQGDYLTWPYPDPPIDLAGFLVRANYGTSLDWGAARALHAGVIAAPPYDISTLSGTQTILVKAVDTSGNESLMAASVVIDLGDLYVENVIDTQSEAPSFAGTITGGAIDTGVLEANLLASQSAYGPPDVAFYGAPADPAYPGNDYEEMTYVATWTPASDQLDDTLLKLELDVAGTYTVDYRIYTSPPAYGDPGDPFYGASDDPAYEAGTLGEWTPWPGELGPFDTTDQDYQIRVTTFSGSTQGAITTMDLIADTPDIEEFYEDVTITVAADGVRLTPAAPRRAIDIVNLTLQDDSGTALTLRIMDKNPTTGTLIKAFDASNTVTTASFDARTKAH